MLININKTRGLLLTGEDLELNENKEYYLLVKVSPVAREERDEEITMKVAIDNGIAVHVKKTDAQYLISHRE